MIGSTCISFIERKNCFFFFNWYKFSSTFTFSPPPSILFHGLFCMLLPGTLGFFFLLVRLECWDDLLRTTQLLLAVVPCHKFSLQCLSGWLSVGGRRYFRFSCSSCVCFMSDYVYDVVVGIFVVINLIGGEFNNVQNGVSSLLLLFCWLWNEPGIACLTACIDVDNGTTWMIIRWAFSASPFPE